MKRIHNRLAILLIFALLLSLAAPVGAAGSRITIRTPEDLVELSRRCSLDSWSRGKTVVLSADLDLSDVEFSSIPTFGGTFDGQGYTISGLTITGSGNVRGLFRYLQSGRSGAECVPGSDHRTHRPPGFPGWAGWQQPRQCTKLHCHGKYSG